MTFIDKNLFLLLKFLNEYGWLISCIIALLVIILITIINELNFKNKMKVYVFLSVNLGILFCVNLLFFNKIHLFFLNENRFVGFQSDIGPQILILAITVITISLSLPDDQVYGVPKNDFRKIDYVCKYQLMDIIIIGLLILSGYFVTELTNFKLMNIGLSIIAIVYSFIFLLQEVPLMLKDINTLKKIIYKNFKYEKTGNPNFRILLSHYMVKNRNSLSIDYVEIEDDLSMKIKIMESSIDVLNNAYEKILSNYSIDKRDFILNDKTLLIENIDSVINFIIELTKKNYNQYFDKEKTKVLSYIFPKLIINTSKVLNLIGLNSNSNYKKQWKMFFEFIFHTIENVEDRGIYYKSLNNLFLFSIKNKDIYFFEIFINIAYNEINISSKRTIYLQFLAVLIHHIVQNQADIDNEFKEQLKILISSYDEKENFTWSQIIFDHRVQMKLEDYYSILNEMLMIFDLSEQEYFWISNNDSKHKVHNMRNFFSRDSIINFWLGYFLSNYIYIKEKSDLVINLNGLKKDDLTVMSKLILNEWVKDKKLNDTSNFEIFVFYSIHINPNEDLAIKLYDYFKENTYKEELKKLNKIDNKLVSQMHQKIKNILKDLQNKDKTTKLINTPEKYYAFYVDTDDINKNLNFYLNSVKDVFENLYKSEGEIKIEYIQNKSTIRYLTDNEVDKYIDLKYKLINGYYKYTKYSNSDEGILLTRNEIVNLIKEKKAVVIVVFECKETIQL